MVEIAAPTTPVGSELAMTQSDCFDADKYCTMASLYYYETKLIKDGYSTIAGVDEAGRGAWAGPLVAGAVILPRKLNRLRDSKILSRRRRELLARYVAKECDWGIGTVEVSEINRHGLTWANHHAMKRAIDTLSHRPDHLLIDYLRLPPSLVGHTRQLSLTDGDALSASIAAASIIAKVTRDRLMMELQSGDKRLKPFSFHRNFGYGTKAHQTALYQYGPTKHHRIFYAPVAQSRQTSIFADKN